MAPGAGDIIWPADWSTALASLSGRMGGAETNITAHATQIDGLSHDIVARLGGKDGAIVGYDGTINPTTTQCYWDAGSTPGNVDGNGEMDISFATAYPHGVLTIDPSNGDGNAAVFAVSVIDHSNSGFRVRCTTDYTPPMGTPLPGTPLVRINWKVLGW